MFILARNSVRVKNPINQQGLVRFGRKVLEEASGTFRAIFSSFASFVAWISWTAVAVGGFWRSGLFLYRNVCLCSFVNTCRPRTIARRQAPISNTPVLTLHLDRTAEQWRNIVGSFGRSGPGSDRGEPLRETDFRTPQIWGCRYFWTFRTLQDVVVILAR